MQSPGRAPEDARNDPDWHVTGCSGEGIRNKGSNCIGYSPRLRILNNFAVPYHAVSGNAATKGIAPSEPLQLKQQRFKGTSGSGTGICWGHWRAALSYMATGICAEHQIGSYTSAKQEIQEGSRTFP